LTNKKTITIGTRGSQLALWQAHYTKASLEKLGHNVTLQIIKTQGDKIQNVTFNKLEGKGFFTKELEDSLLGGDIDLAVHSYKDLPTTFPEGLTITANSYREDPTDWLIINKNAFDKNALFSLKHNAVVGTSSPRRASQLLHFREDLTIHAIRGNVPTRVKKVEEDGIDAVVLAAAGLTRLDLDLSDYEVVELPPHFFIPAPAQGVLAFQIRETDTELKEIIAQIHDEEVAESLHIERSILQKLEGGCQQPIGIFTKKENDFYHLWITHGTTRKDADDTIQKADDFSIQRFYQKHKSPDYLIKSSIVFLKNLEQKTVFITRNLSKDSLFLKSLTQQGHNVIGNSLIDFSQVAFNENPTTNWIFFSSKNAVKHFFEQSPSITPNTKMAAVGNGTTKAILGYGFDVHFEGKQTQIPAVAEHFKNAAKGQSVLFPQAKNSLRHIQQLIKKEVTIHDLVVYDNQIKENFELPEANILVFTSPMNVKAYLDQKSIIYKQKLVAIGPTTAQSLYDAGYENVRLPYNFDELSLADVCY